MSAGAAGAAAAAAAAEQAKKREEEEKLTSYNQSELEGLEFKIVRSLTRVQGERFRQLCGEESKNGWELVEKFDDYRIRFKRPIERRSQDQYAELDPYRTQFGMTDGRLAIIILSAVFGFVGLILAIIFTMVG